MQENSEQVHSLLAKEWGAVRINTFRVEKLNLWLGYFQRTLLMD